MGKKKAAPPPQPQADPALEASISALKTAVEAMSAQGATTTAEWSNRETALLNTQNMLIDRQAQSDALMQSLNDTNAKMLSAQDTAAKMQIPTTAPDAPVTEIGDNAAATADAMRRRAAGVKSRSGRSSLLIPLSPGASGTGLSIPR